MDIGSPSQGAKRPGRGLDNSSLEAKQYSYSCTPLPRAILAYSRVNFALFFIVEGRITKLDYNSTACNSPSANLNYIKQDNLHTGTNSSAVGNSWILRVFRP
jgi:hypothetical protein